MSRINKRKHEGVSFKIECKLDSVKEMIWYMIWYDIWYDMIYDMIWYDIHCNCVSTIQWIQNTEYK